MLLSSKRDRVIEIDVHRPTKTPQSYRFLAQVRGLPIDKEDLISRLHSVKHRYGSLFRRTYRFGFESINFEIRHHEIWDSIYPFNALLRHAGPLYGKAFNRAMIRFDYPILGAVKQFYEARARNLGIALEVRGQLYDKKFHLTPSGRALAFGAGKESRLIYGLLREQGVPVQVFHTLMRSGNGAADIPEAFLTRINSPSHTNRFIAALMSLPEIFYYGSSFGETIFCQPWQMYYCWASPRATSQFADLLASLGAPIRMSVPLTVLPTNIIQLILGRRYPELAARQLSVNPEEQSEKNLNVSIIKFYHGQEFRNHCSEQLFRKMVKEFVEKRLRHPEDLGHRSSRRLFREEICGIIYKRKDDPLFSDVAGLVPESWRYPWIDQVHLYNFPDLEPWMRELFLQYAEAASEPLQCVRYPDSGDLPQLRMA